MIRATLPEADTSNPPFFIPDVVVDIPVPPSVNRARKIDWSTYPRVKNWQVQADRTLIASRQVRGVKKITGPYELQIIIDGKQTGCDLPNLEKLAIDYLVRIEVLADDGPKHLRRLVMEFGDAPKGCRVIVKPMGAA